MADAADVDISTDFKAPVLWGIGYDGSRVSKLARDFAVLFVLRRGLKESAKVIHVAPRGDKLSKVPAALQPAMLKEDVDRVNIADSIDLEFVRVDRPESGTTDSIKLGTTTGEIMANFSDTIGVDVLVMGSFGRKEKGGASGDYLGNTSLNSLRGVNADVFIVNSRHRVAKGDNITWVLATDNSPSARHALDAVLLLMQPGDALKVFYASKFESFAKRVEARHMGEVEKAGMDGEFYYSTILGSQHYGEAILDYASRTNADILVLGCAGHSHSNARAATDDTATDKSHVSLGSVTRVVAAGAPCSLFIVKGVGRHS